MFLETEEVSGEREGQWVWWKKEDPEVKVLQETQGSHVS